MQTCTSLVQHDNYRSCTKQKPNSQRTTKVRLIGGSCRPASAVVLEMSSVSCPNTSVKVGNNVSARKRSGTRRKRSENKHFSLNEIDGNSMLRSSQVSASMACISACMPTNALFTNGSQSLNSSIGNTCVMAETVPLADKSYVSLCPEMVAEGSSKVVKKRTGGCKSNGRSKLAEVKAVRKALEKCSTCKTTTESRKRTAMKRRKCTSNTVNGRFLENMTTFLSEVSKNMVSACVEQTFVQLIQKGLLLSPLASSFSVDNSTVSLLNQSNTINNSNFDQTYSFSQPCIDSLVSTNYPLSASLWNDYSFGAVQQHASVLGDFFALTQNVSPQFGSVGTQVIAVSSPAAVCHVTPMLYESEMYNSFSATSDSVSTCAGSDVGNVACNSQTVQSKNVTDYSLVDLLNMSDDDIDVLLSGFVDCFSDDQLSCSAASCSAASTNAVVVSLSASTCHVNVPVCCSSIASVTEAFNCYQKMDASNFYIGEETFQPDYFELDEVESVASLPTVPDLPASEEHMSTSGKKITIKKPGADSLSMSPVTRRKRQWRSSSRHDTTPAASAVSVAVEATVPVAVPSLMQVQSMVIDAQSRPTTSDLMAVDEVLEGIGSPADEEMWNLSYEIANPDFTDSDSNVLEAVDDDVSPALSVHASSPAFCSSISQMVHSVHVPSPSLRNDRSRNYKKHFKKEEFKPPSSSVPLGKRIRDCSTRRGHPSYNRSARDKYRERSVSRARDVIMASKRKVAGGSSPAHFHPPAVRSPFRVPRVQPLLPEHAGGSKDHGSSLHPDDLHNFRALNTGWLQESIKVNIRRQLWARLSEIILDHKGHGTAWDDKCQQAVAMAMDENRRPQDLLKEYVEYLRHSGMADEHYLTGFVGVCLLQYFYRKHPATAYDVLLRLLTWKIVFIQTLPSGILDAVDVVGMAVEDLPASMRRQCLSKVLCEVTSQAGRVPKSLEQDLCSVGTELLREILVNWERDLVVCSDAVTYVAVPSAFNGFMGLSIDNAQTRVVLSLCQLQSQHTSLVSWQPELLWKCINYLLAQCGGNCRSHFVADVIPLVDLATKMNIYPPLTFASYRRRGLMHLWDFMTQAEIFTVLCVYISYVRRQLGSSLVSLDFRIAGSRRPPDLDPQLQVSSVGEDEFVYRVERALVDNLQLSVNNFRRTGPIEWFIMIEDVASVIEVLPVGMSSGSGQSRSAADVAATDAGRRRSSTVDSTDSSSMSMSSSMDGRTTSKKKFLLATPPPPVSLASNIVPPAVPVTTSSSNTTPMLRAGGNSLRGTGRVTSVRSPNFTHRSVSAADSRCVRQKPAVSVVPPAVDLSACGTGRINAIRPLVQSPVPSSGTFRAPVPFCSASVPKHQRPPQLETGPIRSPSPFRTSVPFDVPRSNYQRPAPPPELRPRHAASVSTATPSSGNVPGFAAVGLQLSQSVVATSAVITPAQVRQLLHVPPPLLPGCRQTAAEVTSSASATIQVSSRQYMANQPLNTTRPHTTTQSTVSRRSDPYNYSGTSGSQASFRPPSVALSTTVNSFQMLGSALVSTGSDRHGSSDAVAAGLAYLRGSVQQPALQPTQTFEYRHGGAKNSSVKEGGVSTSTVSSATPSASLVLRVIESEVLRLLQHYVTANTVLDIDIPTYAGILAETFYEQLQSHGGDVFLSDATLAQLAEYVRHNVERRSRRRTSL